MKKLLENLERMSAEDSSLNASLASVRTLTDRMTGPQGALGGLLGSEENAKKVDRRARPRQRAARFPRGRVGAGSTARSRGRTRASSARAA